MRAFCFAVGSLVGNLALCLLFGATGKPFAWPYIGYWLFGIVAGGAIGLLVAPAAPKGRKR